jgi:putative inorganic carbon (HCO3(-)) transporter
MGLSFFNSGPFLLKSIKTLLAKWLEYFTIFILVQNSFNSKRKLENAFWVIVFTAALVGIDGINQKLFHIDFLRDRSMHKIMHKTDSVTLAITGPFIHYNDLGAYLVGMLSLVLAKLLSKELKPNFRIAFFFLAGILGTCLLFTFSRGAWLGMAFALLCMLILSGKFKELLGIGIFIILIVVYVPVLRARFLFSFQSGGDAARFSIWNSAWLMIKEHPFLGKGLGTFMDYFRFYSSGYLSPQYAHNCYLQMWAESGFFSLLSFIALITVILYQAIKTLKNKSDFFTLGLACSILGFLVHSFFDTQLYSLQLAVFFWVLLGMLVAQIKAVKNPA